MVLVIYENGTKATLPKITYLRMKKADDYYRKNFGMSIFDTFDPPKKNTPVYLVKFPNSESKQPIPENEIFRKI